MNPDIIISNPKKLEILKNKIALDGIKNIHIISDFDRTFTKAFVNRQKVPSMISELPNGNYLTDDYAKKAHALFNKYHPIEIDINITEENKKKLCILGGLNISTFLLNLN
ncbi:MAG: hypothetical protein K0B02_02640 [DPANN group archaeon]|nr:hypothetical protein [DPANN group archaeon]